MSRRAWLAKDLAFALLLALGQVACGGAAATTVAPLAPPSPEAQCPERVPEPDTALEKVEPLGGKRVARICLYGISEEAGERAKQALGMTEGDALDLERISQGLGALIELGTIDDISVSALPFGDEVVLLYTLSERPRITEVSFEGVRTLDDETVARRVPLQKSTPLAPARLHEAVMALGEEYRMRGHRDAQVQAKVVPAGENLVKVRFLVVEGPLSTIGEISFVGMKNVASSKLRELAELEEGAPFEEDRIERALLLLSAYHYDRGMIEARVERSDGEPDEEHRISISFVVHEGEVFRVGKIALAALASAEEGALLGKLRTKPKQIFSRSQITGDIETLKEIFAARGERVDITTAMEVDASKKTVDLILSVHPAP